MKNSSLMPPAEEKLPGRDSKNAKKWKYGFSEKAMVQHEGISFNSFVKFEYMM